MPNTCLVTRLQGVVTGSNLVKFGTLKLPVTRKYLTISDNYTSVLVRYKGLTNGEIPTATMDIPFRVNEVDYAAGEVAELNPASSAVNNIEFKISDVPSEDTYAYISHKYNIYTLGRSGVTPNCYLSAKEFSYLTALELAQAIAVEGGSISEMDCPNLTRLPFLKEIDGYLADYPYPTKPTYIPCSQCSFGIVKNDLLGFTNLTNFSCFANTNVVLSNSDMIAVFSTLTHLDTMDARNTGVECDAESFAAGLKAAGVVSRTITINLYARQWGGTGTTAVTKTFTFDAQGDYVIS